MHRPLLQWLIEIDQVLPFTMHQRPDEMRTAPTIHKGEQGHGRCADIMLIDQERYLLRSICRTSRHRL